ncbi:MAG: tRNA (adenosine(37)-N6)-dimethylallyltransferase MiaA [Candidatus Cloacimonetes bacterium]|nr:tRNA (adenosine(37)-N6)-dimethylallyltransferase MiaA [Candidatus Cloacimonadota bacterium]
MIPLIVIEGATASGKSGLAIQLAKELNTEIISADSRQVYKYMDIGTAKVTPDDLREVKHHLVSLIPPDQSFNAGMFAKLATEAINSIWAANKIPIICGGTGLYVQSLLQGLCYLPNIPQQIRTRLKEQLEAEGIASLYHKLQVVDASFASKISENDSQRILRGLEVFIATGIPISQHWQNQIQDNPYKVFRILLDLPRDLLYNRINDRIMNMIDIGLLEEITGLLSNGYTESSPGLKSLGYKEFLPFINRVSSLEDCLASAAQHHRNYAKRQVTWYRKCTFDLTLADSSVRISEVVNNIKDLLTGEENANRRESI